MGELTTRSGHRWDEPAYQRFADASGAGHELSIAFENGDEVSLDVRRLIDVGEGIPAWSELAVESYELRLPIGSRLIDVGWLDVRALSDDGFANHLADRAGRQAHEVGHRLRLLRERRQLSGRELAERAGITPQSLSRIERGRHDIGFSTLQRLLAAMSYELADLAAAQELEVSPERIRAALAQTGLHKTTVARLLNGAETSRAMLDRVRRIFNWSPTDVAGPGAPPVLGSAALAGRFKAQARGRRAAATYVMYAHKVALLAEQAAERPTYRCPPADPHVMAAEIRGGYGDLGFESVVRYCWDQGIVVVPLFDPGQFHGACWLVGDHPVVVLKQRLGFDARWVFDLGHELCHVVRHLRSETPAIVEFEEIGQAREDEQEEVEASDFAGELLLGDPDAIAQQVVSAAGGATERLRSAVPRVAAREGVDVGVLANYMAYRISSEQGNHAVWGVASNLQSGSKGAADTARRLLKERLDWGRLTDDDAAVLSGALEEEQ
jgi:transcriptional regulator with XRE-family HTH domain/Zn-dependent peptidase ImmA (M78 family)